MSNHPIGPTWRAWLADAKQLDQLAPDTINSYTSYLTSLSRWVGDDLPLAELTPTHIETWLASLNVQASTRRTRLAGVRGFLNWAVDHQLITDNPARRVRSPRVRRRPPPRAQRDDLARALALANPRDRVILVLALQTAVRRGELAGLQVEDFDPAGRRLYIAAAKGLTERWVTVPDEAHRELSNYLAHLGATTGPMWPSSHRPGQGLARGTFNRIVTDAGRRAGVKLWPHLLRHQALSDAAAAGATSHQLQRQSGHRYSSTLDAYVHLSMEDVAPAWEGRAYRAAAG